MGRWLLASLLLVASPALAAPDATVSISNFRFQPDTLEVPAGTSVTWRNGDEEIHAVVAADGSFASPGMDTDQSFTHTFSAPGRYAYRCALHPHMSGVIVVR